MIINIVCNHQGVCNFEDKTLATESFKVADFPSFLKSLRKVCLMPILEGAITRQEIEFITVSTKYLNFKKPKVHLNGLDPYNWTLPSSAVLRLFCLEEGIDCNTRDSGLLSADQIFRSCLQSLNYEK